VKFEKVRHFSATRFYDEIEYLLKRFGIFRFFVLDDAFLLSKRRLQELKDEFLRRCETNPKLKTITFFVMARPESIDRDIVEFMADLRVRVLQIGLQTINPDIQHYMGRPIDVTRFREIKGWLDEFKISLQLDVILGLPNDTIEWMNKTLEYTTSLKPMRIQLKQFYLNPFTLFHVDRDKYGIVTDSDRDVFDYDFDAPYVVSANGIDQAYFEETSAFIRSQIEKHPEIHWKYLARKERFVSQAYYPRAKNNIVRWSDADAPGGADRAGAPA
jgi:coproporphyrinogen III oxidase-like Fe-S oxidoreductase